MKTIELRDYIFQGLVRLLEALSSIWHQKEILVRHANVKILTHCGELYYPGPGLLEESAAF